MKLAVGSHVLYEVVEPQKDGFTPRGTRLVGRRAVVGGPPERRSGFLLVAKTGEGVWGGARPILRVPLCSLLYCKWGVEETRESVKDLTHKWHVSLWPGQTHGHIELQGTLRRSSS